MNMREFIEDSPLNWLVEKRQAFIQVGDEFKPVPNRFFTTKVKDGVYTPFEAVADGYTIIQNHDGFKVLTDLVDSGDIVVDSALELSGGKTVAISARLPESVEIAGNEVDTHLVFGSNHARGGSAVIFSHNRQLCCANELATLKIAKQYKYTIPHRRSAFIKLEDARQGLRLSFQHTQEMKELLEQWATEPMSKTQYNGYLRDIVELDKKDPESRAHRNARGIIYAIHNIARNADYIDNYRNTKAGFYQAVSDYASNVAQYRTYDSRFRKLTTGHPLTNRAHELLTA